MKENLSEEPKEKILTEEEAEQVVGGVDISDAIYYVTRDSDYHGGMPMTNTATGPG